MISLESWIFCVRASQTASLGRSAGGENLIMAEQLEQVEDALIGPDTF